ncbi:hypothetical protein PsYK624_090870 [Phanerochaete sordida]|uniref:Uncharacterized protein n=1 Tax=Phanerochaete sordida TaxID=48140 RepID=A0A9P3GBB9_9APHY|nr:hypothetical protein PsYK624_090870 [Phanerochaete sordida]
MASRRERRAFNCTGRAAGFREGRVTSRRHACQGTRVWRRELPSIEQREPISHIVAGNNAVAESRVYQTIVGGGEGNSAGP